MSGRLGYDHVMTTSRKGVLIYSSCTNLESLLDTDCMHELRSSQDFAPLDRVQSTQNAEKANW